MLKTERHEKGDRQNERELYPQLRDLRRKLREQRAAYEELLGLSGAILAALCVRCGDGATLRLPKQAVHDALETYEFAAAADGENYVLSYRERAT